jgi:hypothetical protein
MAGESFVRRIFFLDTVLHQMPIMPRACAVGANVGGSIPSASSNQRRQAREAWLRLRSKEADKAGGREGDRETLQSEAQPKDDLAL